MSLMGHLGPEMGSMGPKIALCRFGMDTPKLVRLLFSLNVDSEWLQYLIVRFKSRLGGSETGLKTHAAISHWLRHYNSLLDPGEAFDVGTWFHMLCYSVGSLEFSSFSDCVDLPALLSD